MDVLVLKNLKIGHKYSVFSQIPYIYILNKYHFMTFKHFRVLTLTFALLFIAASSFAQLRLPPGYYWKQLPNGLQVLVIENSKVPLATVEIAVKNGAFTEDSVYNGLSHLFENMFFKANTSYPTQEVFLKRTQDLGAIWNGPPI